MPPRSLEAVYRNLGGWDIKPIIFLKAIIPTNIYREKSWVTYTFDFWATVALVCPIYFLSPCKKKFQLRFFIDKESAEFVD